MKQIKCRVLYKLANRKPRLHKLFSVRSNKEFDLLYIANHVRE